MSTIDMRSFNSTGAHQDAAYEMTGHWVDGGTYDARNKRFDVGGNQVYILRPKVANGP